jgi:hypothetical protein
MNSDAEEADTDGELYKDFQFDPNYELKLNKAWVETGVVCSMYATGKHKITYLARYSFMCFLGK